MVRLVRLQPQDRGPPLTAIRWTFATPRAWLIAGSLLLLYGVLYLLVAKALIVDPAGRFSGFGPLPLLLLPERLALGWTEPAFVLYASDSIVFAPSVPAILTVLVLGSLVGVNGAMAVETLARRPAACDAGGGWWSLAVLPSFLASFSCCAPTLLLLVGAGTAGAVISVVPFVVPAAGLLLLGSVALAARRLRASGAAL